MMQVGGVLGALVAEGVLLLKEVGTATIKAAVEEEDEDGQLVDAGSAWKMIGAVLRAVAEGTSQAHMARQWKETALDFKAFFPQVLQTNSNPHVQTGWICCLSMIVNIQQFHFLAKTNILAGAFRLVCLCPIAL